MILISLIIVFLVLTALPLMHFTYTQMVTVIASLVLILGILMISI
jgi:hypothetical protein